MYVRDSDHDGLYAHEEYLYGTYDSQAAATLNNVQDPKDSDGDGLSDYDEVRLGWNVGRANLVLVKPYDQGARVFSDPSRPDSDQDGVTDLEEKAMGTDPNNSDTDGDRYADGPGSGGPRGSEGKDPDPLDPSITGNKPPTIAKVTHEMTGLRAALKVFAADADANIQKVTVDWGDSTKATTITAGISGNLPTPETTHEFSKMGAYTATIEVVDKFGKLARANYEIKIAIPTGGLIGEWLFEDGSIVQDRVGNTANVGELSKRWKKSNEQLLKGEKSWEIEWSDLDAQGSKGLADGHGSSALLVRDRFKNPQSALLFNTSNTPNSGDPTASGCLEIPGRPSYKQGDNYVHAARLALDQNFTIAIWIQPDANGGSGWIVGQSDSGFKQPWMRLQMGQIRDEKVPTGQVALVMPGSTAPPLVAVDPTKPAKDAWTFYVAVVTRNGAASTIVLYRNGTEVARAQGSGDYVSPVPLGSSAARLFVACPNDEDSYKYQGAVDDLRIYDRMLTPQEIQMLYAERGWPR